MEIYRTREGEPTPIDLAEARGRDFLQRYDGYALVQRVLFEQRRQSLTIEAAMNLTSDVVTRLQTAIVGERKPDQQIAVAPDAARRVARILAQDLDGDGREDISVYIEPDRKREREEGMKDETQQIYLWLSATESTASAK